MAQKNQLTTADHLDFEEFKRFLNCLHEDKLYLWELYARVSFYTACRAYDVLKLRWIDILDKQEVIVCEKKTHKKRKIWFTARVRDKITSLWKLLGQPNTALHIFLSEKCGEPYSIQFVNRMLKRFKYKYALNIGNFSTHTFRKTFGRYVYDENGHSAESLMLLNKILNHSNLQVTQTYIGITQDEIDNIYKSIKI